MTEFETRKSHILAHLQACIDTTNQQAVQYPHMFNQMAIVMPCVSVLDFIPVLEKMRIKIESLEPEHFNNVDSALSFMTKLLERIQNLPGNISVALGNNALNTIPSSILSIDALIDTVAIPNETFHNTDSTIKLSSETKRKLKIARSEIDVILHEEEQLRKRVSAINQCYEETKDLPNTVAEAIENSKKVEAIFHTSSAQQISVESKLKEAEELLSAMKTSREETAKIVDQCMDNQRITSTMGLAAGFDAKARQLNKTMYWWVAGLVGGLFIGGCVASNSFDALHEVLKDKSTPTGSIVVHAIVAVLSLGAPLWLCWLATKQITQRFRLSEDYSFKATIAKAYEGYKKETVNMDPKFSEKLFETALTRLDEAPLRLVKDEQAGSPWHELFASKAFKQWSKKFPDLSEIIKSVKSTEEK